MTDQEKDRMFGELGIDLDFFSAEEFSAAVENQRIDEAIGAKRPIASYLLEAGKLTKEQIAKIIAFQAKFSPKQSQSSSLPSAHVQLPSSPPSIGSLVNNTVVWFVAFAPIWGKIIETMIAQRFYGSALKATAAVKSGEYWYVTGFIMFLLCVFDENQLRKSGHNTDYFKNWSWIIPVYIYRRSRSLNQSLLIFFVWLACMFLSAAG